jgi:hypothetical protein
MGRDTQRNPLGLPSCNLSGFIWFEADGTPADLINRMEGQLGITCENAAREPGEYSYRAGIFGFEIQLTITPKWGAGILCAFTAGTAPNLLDFDAPFTPFGWHLARLVERYGLGRLISREEVDRRWDEEHS